MTVLAWPSSLFPSDQEWELLTNTQSSRSPFTRTGQDVELQGAGWWCQLTFDALTPDEERELSGLLSALRGPIGRIAVPDFGFAGNRGGATGTLTATAGARSKIVTIAGVGGTAPHFRRGDRLGIGGRLHEVCFDVTASAGSAEVEIAPPLRAEAAAAPVITLGMTTIMQLPNDKQHRRRKRGSAPSSRQIELVEAFT
jgi:hypothetical protein